MRCLTVLEKLIKAIIFLLILLFGYYVYSNLERREVVVNIGPTSEVIRNPYLAAEQLLQQKGVDTIKYSKPPKSEDFNVDSMLIITDNRSLASRDVAEDLYEWVKSGGHLVWSVRRYKSEWTDALSELSQVTGYYSDEEEDSNSSGEAGIINDLLQDEGDEDKPVSELFEEHNERLKKERLKKEELEEKSKQASSVDGNQKELTPSQQVEQDIIDVEADKNIDQLVVLLGKKPSDDLYLDLGCTCFYLDHPFINPGLNISDREAVGLADQSLLYSASPASDEGKKLLHFRVGNGHMTVLTSTSIWTNDEIGLFDHAHFLQTLAGDASQVIFQSNVEWPSLWQLLLDWAMEFVVIATILFFAALIKLGVRFGPIKEEILTVRRSIIEHIRAMAKFHWRHQHVGHLASPLRTEINQKMRIVNSEYDQLNDQGRYQLIAERVQLPVEDVEKVFTNQDMLTDGQFCQAIKLLEKIRKTL